MTSMLDRRHFLASASGALAAGSALSANDDPDQFSFVLLGDLHFDKLEHHDFPKLEEKHQGDIRQIHNYSRITSDIMPALFARVREAVASERAAFVLQVGDLVEGLCGSEDLAVTQNREAVEFVKSARLGVPFLFTKGNHDVTGDGAPAAFGHVFHPFLSEQTSSFQGAGKLNSANYAVQHHDSLFCSFDAYDKSSLDWLESALAKRTARHCFVAIHPPVVPYGARSTWHLYSSAKDAARREKLLGLLGRENAIVLGGHIHKYNLIARETAGGGRFTQLAISSVIGEKSVKPRNELAGIDSYTGDQIRVEPEFSPTTEPERRTVYDAERPFVKRFEYADLPGYAVVTVHQSRIIARIYSGVSDQIWKTIDLATS
ncbi:MAG TPA: metallophosphoesterase [Caulifigura sp.]|jgi:UDP-2,3-diacylglucosamine pyrophosphatase LpxH|nr:metallophosphoesterase [Caulifigura sp.]